jgi:hypothetical protein
MFTPVFIVYLPICFIQSFVGPSSA